MFDSFGSRINKVIDVTKRNDLCVALFLGLVVIIVGTWLGWYNNTIIPLYPNPHFHYLSSNPLKLLSNWDGPDYINIAKHGYQNILNASFFPFYPLLIRGFYYVVRSYLMSALFISWASLVGAIYFFIKLVKQLGLATSQSGSATAVLFWLLFPTGVFLIATYTSSLYALLALSSIYFALNRRYWLSGGLLFLATLTHITGVFVVVLDLLILFEQKLPLKKIAATAIIGFAGIGTFAMYSWLHLHDIFAFVKSQHQIHGWLHFDYTSLFTTTDYLNALFVLMLLASAVYFWSRRKSFAIYALLFLLIPLVGGIWGGFNRYVLTAFPIPLMIYGLVKEKRFLMTLILVLSVMLYTYTLLQYAGGYIGS